MTFDALDYRYPSTRNLTFGTHGMVCTSQPLAAQAGLEILKKGGNAVDAILAAATTLPIVEPNSNGIGSDCFAIIYKDGKLYGLNGSGPSPKLVSAEEVKKAGYDTIPEKGWLPVMVPGAPGAWDALSKRFGTMPLSEVMASGIRIAEEGYAVTPVIAHCWQAAAERMEREKERPECAEWFKVFLTSDKEQGIGEDTTLRAPRAGEIMRFPLHAQTLRKIAENGADVFYRGELADRIDEFSKATDGFLRKDDMAAYEPRWIEPIKTTYKGYEIVELPPNDTGMIPLMALNIMEEVAMVSHDDPETVHRQIEAMKLAYSDGQRYVSDPSYVKEGLVEALLSKEYAAKRRALMGDRARLPEYGDPFSGGTVYLCAVDKDGCMVSYIQSGFDDFGSGIVIPGTGISMLDRGCCFSLDPSNPNYMEGGKYSYHTIIPGFLMKDGKPMGPFGVMGGYMQPQGHFQVMMNLIDFGMNPQEALNAPRWQWKSGNEIDVEAGFDPDIVKYLEEKGHIVSVPKDSFSMGRGQMILRMDNGVYAGATEPRADGMVAAY